MNFESSREDGQVDSDLAESWTNPKAAKEDWGRAIWEAYKLQAGSSSTPHCWITAPSLLPYFSWKLEIYSLERVKQKVLDQQHSSVTIHNEGLTWMSKPIALFTPNTTGTSPLLLRWAIWGTSSGECDQPIRKD